MILVLFHVLYLFGKYVYDSYHIKKRKIATDQPKTMEKLPFVSEEIYNMIDPEAPQDYKPDIKFFPAAYIQRYVTVSNILLTDKYKGKIRKVVDFGCAELKFFVYLKNIEHIEEILCVDVDRSLLEANKAKAEPWIAEYLHCRANPLVVHVCEGSVTDNDRRLEKTDAVICIELIEHLYPETLTDLPFNIFGYIKPKLAIITTPNADFNVLFPMLTEFRHPDHKFEWTREQFQDWAHNIVLRYPDYEVTFHGICNGPKGTEHLGACTQMAVFHCKNEENNQGLPGIDNLFKIIASYEYPFKIDNRSDEKKILDEAVYYIRRLSFQVEDLQEEFPLERLLPLLDKFNVTVESLRTILVEAGWVVLDSDKGPFVLIPQPSTFSNYSTIDDNFSDIERWNDEAVPPIDYHNGYTHEEFTYNDTWSEEAWDEEPSIVIPQSNSIVHENNTYLFDGENESSNVNCVSNRVNIHELSANPLSNSALQNTPVPFTTNSDTLPDNNTPTILNAHNDNNTSMITKEVNRTLDFHHCTFVSCSSMSPPPLSIHLDQMNSSYHDDNILIHQNMLCESSLMNNTFHSLHTLKDKDSEEATANYFIHMNIPLSEKILPCTKEQSSYSENETADHLEANIKDCQLTTMETENVCYVDRFCVEEHPFSSSTNESTMKPHPQYTSSPRVLAKNKEIYFNCTLSRTEKDVSSNNTSDTQRPVDELRHSIDNDVLSICQTPQQNYNNTGTLAVSVTNCSTSESVESVNESKRKLSFPQEHSLLSSYQNSTDTLNDKNSFVPLKLRHVPNTDRSNTEDCHFVCAKKNSNSRNNSLSLEPEGKENVSSIKSEKYVNAITGFKDYSNNFNLKCNISPNNTIEGNKNMEVKPNSPEFIETPPNSWSPEIMDSGYPNSASAQDMTPEYDLPSIAHDQIPDSESPSVAEAPQLPNLELIEVENGDLANNNRDGEGNNMVALIDNHIENLQPFINVLENDIENENDIYFVENGFPMWLLRILEMANPMDVDGHILRDHRELHPFDPIAGINHDEGFNSSSSEGDSDENNEGIAHNNMDENYIDNDNEIMQDTDTEDDNVANALVSMPDSASNADSDEWIVEKT